MQAMGQTEADARGELVSRYVALVERLYVAGARAFAFNLVGPFDRTARGSSYGELSLRLHVRQSSGAANDADARPAGQYHCVQRCTHQRARFVLLCQGNRDSQRDILHDI